jgi:tetratricopeptide (TPR) repeat protein
MRFLVILLLALLPNFQAQNTNHIVEYSACCASDQTAEVAATVLQQVQEELVAYNIEVEFLRVGANGLPNTSHLARVDFQEVFDGERIIVGFDATVYPIQTPLRTVSPFLRDGLRFNIPLSESKRTNIIAAIIAYTTGECTLIDNIESSQVDRRFDFYRANCAVMEGDFSKAATLYPNVLNDGSGDFLTPTVANLAWTYLQVDEQDAAFQLLKSVIADQRFWSETSDEVQTYVLRSQLYALAFRYDEAIADMDAAIALDPNRPSLYTERGQRIMLTYEWDRALADYNHALELDPAYADAYYFRGVLYASVPEGINAHRLALADFQHYLALAPDGQHAADAERYAGEIQAQLDALGS